MRAGNSRRGVGMNARGPCRNAADFGEGENAMTTVTSGQTYTVSSGVYFSMMNGGTGADLAVRRHLAITFAQCASLRRFSAIQHIGAGEGARSTALKRNHPLYRMERSPPRNDHG
jgi:hypothetical protein